MIFGVTGHRDVEQKPGELDQFARLSVARMVCAGASEIITGLARGWDMAVGLACCEMNVPYRAYIPFKGQDQFWSPEDRSLYINLLCDARSIFTEGDHPFNRFYLLRDQRIVRDSVELWALDSGRPSGSHTTVLYAEEIGRKVEPLWEDWKQFRKEHHA